MKIFSQYVYICVNNFFKKHEANDLAIPVFCILQVLFEWHLNNIFSWDQQTWGIVLLLTLVYMLMYDIAHHSVH